MSQKKSHLRAFWPIHGTPYLFCDVRKKIQTGLASNTRFSNMIIDIRRGKCILRVEWQNLKAARDSQKKSSRHTEYKGMLLNNGQISLIYEQIFRYDSSQFKRKPEEKPSAAFKKKKDLWRIDIQGDIQKVDDPPDLFIQNQPSYRCLNFSNLIAVSANRLMQFQLEGNELEQCGGWEEIGDSLMQLCSLPNKGFLFSNTKKGTVAFLLPNETRAHSFSLKSIFSDVPAPPKDITPWEQLSSLSWQLIPLSTRGTSPLLAYFQMPGFPIFEINLDRIRYGTEKDVFTFLGFSPSCRPFISMRENRMILFTNTLVRRGDELSTGVPIYALEKKKKGWPTEYGFNFQPQSIRLPASIQRICEIPIDDEYLLAYGQDTFWAVRSDGSTVKPIYPKSGPFRKRH